MPRLPIPPATGDPNLDLFLRYVTDEIEILPVFSVQSFTGSPNNSNFSGIASTLLFNITPSAASRLWVNASGTTTSWITIA